MSTEPRVTSPGGGFIACAALAFVLAAFSTMGQNPSAEAQSQDAHANTGQYRIEAIVIRGTRQIPASTIQKSISNRVGDAYDQVKVAQDVAALKATGYFDDVRVETGDTPAGGKIVIFYVDKRDESLPPGTPPHPPSTPPDEIGKQYREASKLLWDGELRDAQSAFEAILQNRPNYARAKVLLGLTLVRLSEQSGDLGETTLAVAQIRQALVQDPDEAYWHSTLARLLHAQGNAEEATNECTQAAKLSPGDADLAWGCGFGARPEIAKDDAIPKGTDLAAAPDSTPPIPLHRPNPPYSEKARAAQYQATSVLWAVVGVDGAVEQVAVEKPAGLGLDEAALEAVHSRTFKPATRNGAPIRVRIKSEITFRLF